MIDGLQSARANPPLLELRQVSRRFGSVQANDQISLTLGAGEVLGLLGENGAGKSTLMRILAGEVSADSGQILVGGSPVELSSPLAARRSRIGMVHQHFSLVGSLSIESNIALWEARWGRVLVRRSELRHHLQQWMNKLDMRLDLDAPVATLGIVQQQQAEILKAMSTDPRILILDEPTAVLTNVGRESLFALVQSLQAAGTGVLLISHQLSDLRRVCQRVTVLRKGRVVGSRHLDECSDAELIALMVGGQVPLVEPTSSVPGPEALQAEQIVVYSDRGEPKVRGVSFTLHAGQIVALCGIEGSGQTELLEALAGMRTPAQGKLHYGFVQASEPVPRRAAELRRHGLGHVPEDRHLHGICADLSVLDNWMMTRLFMPQGYESKGLLDRQTARAHCLQAIERFDIQVSSIDAPLAHLSGGNQQKLVMARELQHQPKALLAAYPTRGLDIRTVQFVKSCLIEARNAGCAVLLLSADIEEVMDLADAVMVMTDGRLRGPVPIESMSHERIGEWMTSRT